jgi:hypothetical protein
MVGKNEQKTEVERCARYVRRPEYCVARERSAGRDAPALWQAGTHCRYVVADRSDEAIKGVGGFLCSETRLRSGDFEAGYDL